LYTSFPCNEALQVYRLVYRLFGLQSYIIAGNILREIKDPKHSLSYSATYLFFVEMFDSRMVLVAIGLLHVCQLSLGKATRFSRWTTFRVYCMLEIFE